MSTLKRKAGNQSGASDAKKPKQNGSIMSFFGAPKPAPAAPEAAAGVDPAESAPPSFNKEKWVASLTDEQRELLTLEIETLHESWLALLKDDIAKKEFLDLKRFLKRETDQGKRWFPPAEDVYSWSRHCPFNKVKVVILGQDPYHNVNQAHGLAFSVRPPTPAPPSLRNMYIALAKDYPTFKPPPNKGGLLTPWADRGVLLLNTCLTVRAHEAFSHSNRGWEALTQRVIDLVAAKRTRGVVFVAWGTPAGKRVTKIDQKRHLVLKSVHPSPLSASRGFFDCGHFRKANEWLVTRYGEGAEVDWSLGGEGAPAVAAQVAPTVAAAAAAPANRLAPSAKTEAADVKVVEKENVKEGEANKVEDEKAAETEERTVEGSCKSDEAFGRLG